MYRGAPGTALGAALVLATALAPGLSAQSPAEADPILAQLARLDSLMALRDEVARARDSLSGEIRVRDSLRWSSRTGLDTISIGPFTLVGRTSGLERVEPLVGAAWASEVGLWGEEGEAQLKGTTFLVSAPGAAIPRTVLRQLRERPAHHILTIPGRRHPTRARRAASEAVAAAILEALPTELREWAAWGRLDGVPGARIRLREVIRAWAGAAIDPEGALRQVHRELAMAPTTVGRRCYQGVLGACRLALGLEHPGPDREGWYGPDELQALVADRMDRSPTTRSDADAQACVHQGEVERCLAFFHERGGPPSPLGEEARVTMLREVALIGGREAVGVLFRDPEPGTAAARIERAVPGSLEAVVERWMDRVEAHAPQPPDPPLRARLSTLFWLAVLAGLAMRSTRWRLG